MFSDFVLPTEVDIGNISNATEIQCFRVQYLPLCVSGGSFAGGKGEACVEQEIKEWPIAPVPVPVPVHVHVTQEKRSEVLYVPAQSHMKRVSIMSSGEIDDLLRLCKNSIAPWTMKSRGSQYNTLSHKASGTPANVNLNAVNRQKMVQLLRWRKHINASSRR
jgi:hypothetical protein